MKVSGTESTGMYIVDIFSVVCGTPMNHLTVKCIVIQICSNASYEHEVMEYRATYLHIDIDENGKHAL